MATPKEYEWRHLNSRRNYPFTDSSTLKLGSTFIPKGWAIDSSFSLNCGSVTNDKCYLSAVNRAGSTITLSVSVGSTEVAKAVFDTKTPERHIKFYSTVSSRYAGSLVVDPTYTVVFSNAPEGRTPMSSSSATICPSTVFFAPTPSVTSLRAHGTVDGVNGGEVYLVGGDGVNVSESDDGKITVDILGDANYARTGCEDIEVETSITKLHSITPAYVNATGDVTISNPVSAGVLGNLVFSASDHFTGVDGDSYDSEKPTLRIYKQGNTLMFEIAGLNKAVS